MGNHVQEGSSIHVKYEFEWWPVLESVKSESTLIATKYGFATAITTATTEKYAPSTDKTTANATETTNANAATAADATTTNAIKKTATSDANITRKKTSHRRRRSSSVQTGIGNNEYIGATITRKTGRENINVGSVQSAKRASRFVSV